MSGERYGARPVIAPAVGVPAGEIDHYIVVAILKAPPGQDAPVKVARDDTLTVDLGVAMLDTAAGILKEGT